MPAPETSSSVQYKKAQTFNTGGFVIWGYITCTVAKIAVEYDSIEYVKHCRVLYNLNKKINR